jgi:hypothetical protein
MPTPFSPAEAEQLEMNGRTFRSHAQPDDVLRKLSQNRRMLDNQVEGMARKIVARERSIHAFPNQRAFRSHCRSAHRNRQGWLQ